MSVVLSERAQEAIDLGPAQAANDTGTVDEEGESERWLDNLKRTFFSKQNASEKP